MFTIIKMIAGLIGIVVIAGVVLYLLPSATKEKTLTFISGVIPDSLKAQAEQLLLTPPEQRAKIIAKVEENLVALKELAEPKAKELVSQTETLLTELKEKNEAQSLPEIVKGKLVEQFINKPSAEQCATPAPAQP